MWNGAKSATNIKNKMLNIKLSQETENGTDLSTTSSALSGSSNILRRFQVPESQEEVLGLMSMSEGAALLSNKFGFDALVEWIRENCGLHMDFFGL